MDQADAALVGRARDAAARGDWRQAHDLFTQADALGTLGVGELALLADAAYAAGHLDASIETWERVHAAGVRVGDNLAAAGAAVRVARHLLFDTALLAPVRGWLTRAERLLEGHDDTAVHAWLAVVRNYERLLSGDFEGARRWARRAIDVGAVHDPAAAAIGRVAEARSLILQGDVTEGLLLLNEAALATVTGELDPLSTGVVYCELVCAFQALALYDLADEWTQAMERWHHGQPVGSLHGRCRVHRAEILRLRGSCAEAEEQALLACEELRPYLRRELGWPLTELGRIRFRRGDLPGAEQAFLAAHQAGWDPQPGLALVHLARGEVALAATSIREALEHPLNVPSKEWPPNTELRRAPLLEAQVEIELAADEIERARSAADELERVAAVFQSRALSAGAALARGRVRLADADAAGAGRDFQMAAQTWNEIGAPYETAVARMGVAQALRGEGKEARALLEFRAAGAEFERIGASLQASRAAHACGNPDAGTIGATRDIRGPSLRVQPDLAKVEAPPNDRVFRREGDYWSIVFEGHTARVRDSKGLRYLARLLADPGREFHVLHLVALERDALDPASATMEAAPGSALSGDAGELLDQRARAAYRRRLAEIDEDLEEARVTGNLQREAQAEAERDCVVRELARAVGLGGRERRVGSAAERARSAVTRAVRQAMTRIRGHHPALATHFDRAVRTGTYCAYLPDSRMPAAWNP
ncbi:MAG: transcriptional regulator [Acidobacteriota bacterium]|nr:transcriptional regulator [Acidobacteriota bacterium]